MTINGTQASWSNPKTPIKFSIPYTLKDGENGNNITVYFIGNDGTLENMQGVYNSDTKMVTFYTTHFSKYYVKENKVSFADLKGFEAYQKYIENMAS
ncbi:hypothetical protein EHE19_006730 [Ruminiclostridium herbifermentans]|uniref:Uncharacterized protein n=1 Tax=Ruminiclostridium herbifermentans TaxID=2488810 RepID=A0A4U7J8E2_9FIRM|nr:hypothetical protein [Ruminiclostridium herbifermentans]QNU68122.1 hypothetical protein EHE19_006730 [Ruminiclostridium herbifermentans]